MLASVHTKTLFHNKHKDKLNREQTCIGQPDHLIGGFTKKVLNHCGKYGDSPKRKHVTPKEAWWLSTGASPGLL